MVSSTNEANGDVGLVRCTRKQIKHLDQGNNEKLIVTRDIWQSQAKGAKLLPGKTAGQQPKTLGATWRKSMIQKGQRKVIVQHTSLLSKPPENQ